MDTSKPYILVAVIALLIGTIYFINIQSVQRGNQSEIVNVTPRTIAQDEIVLPNKLLDTESKNNIAQTKLISSKLKAQKYVLAKEITTPDGFINTLTTDTGQATHLTIGEFIGKKVILIDFWTYSCINCQRTTPYLNAWYEKYKDQGLVIIGIHTPEFEFEKSLENVKLAVEKFGIKFPVVLDNDFSTWTAYKNQYWPRKYLIDIDGYIVYDHIGEGGYEETEKIIQEALTERQIILQEKVLIDQQLTKNVSIPSLSGSPEIYFGANRNSLFKNGTSGVVGTQKNLVIPTTQIINTLYLTGNWNIANEFASNDSDHAQILYRYTAKDVFMVAQSKTANTIEVRRDGQPLGPEAGKDIFRNPDGKTFLKVQEARLYEIIKDQGTGSHNLELDILNPGLEAFTFTFG
jgi:thiol-disulfide isomerase/thioredoxin